jgi:hypothetical protein
MAAIEALVLAVAAIAIVFAVILVVVITGIHQEERRGTLARENPPTGLARLTRQLLGAHFCLGVQEQWAQAGPHATDFPPATAGLAGPARKDAVLAGLR